MRLTRRRLQVWYIKITRILRGLLRAIFFLPAVFFLFIGDLTRSVWKFIWED